MASQKKKFSVLFVCLGNICRSPTAEAVLKKLINSLDYQDLFHVESAGTAGYHIGEPPDARTRKHGERRGLQFTSVGQQFNHLLHFDFFDYILCMDGENYKDIIKLDTNNKYEPKIFQIMSFASDTGYASVPDPYYGDAKDFELVIDLLEVACQDFLKKLLYT